MPAASSSLSSNSWSYSRELSILRPTAVCAACRPPVTLSSRRRLPARAPAERRSFEPASVSHGSLRSPSDPWSDEVPLALLVGPPFDSSRRLASLGISLCEGRDSNPRTPTGADLKSAAFVLTRPPSRALYAFDGSSYTDFGRATPRRSLMNGGFGVRSTSRPSGSVRTWDQENRKQENALGAVEFCSRAARPAQGASVASLPGTRCRWRATLFRDVVGIPRIPAACRTQSGNVGRTQCIPIPSTATT